MIQVIPNNHNVDLKMLRLDQIHPRVQGNKYYKLKYNLVEASSLNCNTLITFGGAFSNHIHATAFAGKQEGFSTIGIIRGEEPTELNITLQEAKQFGMQLLFISRTDYRVIRRDKNLMWEYLSTLLGKEILEQSYILPEGGTNELALKGTAEILKGIPVEDYDIVCLPVGTGGTIAGVISTLPIGKRVIGFPALKGDFLRKDIEALLHRSNENWDLNTDYHFGGYAKWNEELVSFINTFKKENSIPLCPIYTGKMMFGLMDLLGKHSFVEGTKIMAIHTGGLQGIKGFNERFGNILLT